jgi:hypothetical protein
LPAKKRNKRAEVVRVLRGKVLCVVAGGKTQMWTLRKRQLLVLLESGVSALKRGC